MAGLTGTAFITIARPPAPVAGKIGTPVQIATGVPVDIQPVSEQPLLEIGGKTVYRSVIIFTTGVTVPDIRLKDEITNPGNIDPFTNAPTVYIVRGVRTWDNDHLEILGERPIGV